MRLVESTLALWLLPKSFSTDSRVGLGIQTLNELSGGQVERRSHLEILMHFSLAFDIKRGFIYDTWAIAQYMRSKSSVFKQRPRQAWRRVSFPWAKRSSSHCADYVDGFKADA